MSELGQRIAEERERRGLTRATLARRVGVSDVSVHYWERGVIKQIGHGNLLALAGAFGLTVSELLDDGVLDEVVARKQAEVLYEFTHGSYVMPASLNLAMCERAKELRQQGGERPGLGKCNDPGCPAHYATEPQEGR